MKSFQVAILILFICLSFNGYPKTHFHCGTYKLNGVKNGDNFVVHEGTMSEIIFPNLFIRFEAEKKSKAPIGKNYIVEIQVNAVDKFRDIKQYSIQHVSLASIDNLINAKDEGAIDLINNSSCNE